MTVIAWDGTTLAADKRQTTEYGSISECTKIGRHTGRLWGVGGDEPKSQELLAWWKAGADPASFPAHCREPVNQGTLVTVRLDGCGRHVVESYTKGPYPCVENQGGPCAFGSGRDFALGAMECGRNAVDAVLVASKFNAWCGNGVDTLRLEDDDDIPF